MINLAARFSEDEDAGRHGTLTQLFEEEPVGMEVFLRDRKYLGADWMLSPLQMELVQTIERVYLPELYPIMAEGFGGYWQDVHDLPMKNLIAAEWGKGGGKDSTVRVASLRVAYLLMCMKSPQRYFGMPEDDSIHMLNIAVNAPQAHRAFFEPLTKMVKRGWFKDRAEAHRDTITYEKNLTAISGHSDAESQEGLNIILGVADEIDAFKAKGEMVGQGNRAREASTSAESILNMLKTSASTRFPLNYKRVAISYPRYLGSTIQTLRKEAADDVEEVGDRVSIYFASGPYATWDVNPLRSKEQFASDYRKDPEEAAAKYECKPTRAQDSYFRNMPLVKLAVDDDTQPIQIEYSQKAVTSKKTGETVMVWEPDFIFHESFQPIQGARYAMHADLALRGDRAGIAMSHTERMEEIEELLFDEEGTAYTAVNRLPIIRNDFTLSFTADLTVTPAREIQIRWARKLCYELIKRGFAIVRFTFDGFQSADSMQMLTMHGIESKRVSLDINDDVWKAVRDVLYSGRITLPYSELLLTELEGLSKIGNGKVDHPPGGSKDLADAFGGSVVGAIEEGGQEDADGLVVELGGSIFIRDESGLDLIGTESLTETIGDPLGMPIGMEGYYG